MKKQFLTIVSLLVLLVASALAKGDNGAGGNGQGWDNDPDTTNTATRIDSLLVKDTNTDTWFDLNGRICQPTQKNSILICNHKKIVIR